MTHTLHISSPLNVDLPRLIASVGLPLEYAWTQGADFPDEKIYYVWQPEISTTVFCIETHPRNGTTLSMDGLAAWEDYRLFPYLADCLSAQLCGKGIADIFKRYNEAWTAEAIGEAVAYVKVYLSLGKRYYLHNPLVPFQFIDNELLATVGTSYRSSTPRIFGYIQYLLRHHKVKTATEVGFETDGEEVLELEADVPQHVSIGRVKSWQTDGSVTWQSFSQADVELLLDIARRHESGLRKADGVVLNDIGTLYQEGIGVKQDGRRAAYWFGQAIEHGDLIYAPSNLGDIHRKGCPPLPISLRDAFEAYALGQDPYAHYRIGQGLEEGWTGQPDPVRAVEWFKRAAAAGHHLAIRRLAQSSESSPSAPSASARKAIAAMPPPSS